MKSSKIIIILSIALALLFAIVGFYNFATAGEAISEDKISWIKETPIAHRGLHTKDIPENSLSAFENALKNNYAIVSSTAEGDSIIYKIEGTEFKKIAKSVYTGETMKFYDANEKEISESQFEKYTSNISRIDIELNDSNVDKYVK